MQATITISIAGQPDEVLAVEISGSPTELEEQSHALGKKVGAHLAQQGLQEHLQQQNPLRCCHRPMHKNGRRTLHLTALDGKIKLSAPRFRCSKCERERTPTLDDILCGPHRITRPLARRVCQLATTEHFTHLAQRVYDQHGASLSHAQLQQLVLTVGTAAENQRRAEVELKRERLASGLRPLPPPAAEVLPKRVYVSCDGIMYCTNLREPDPHQEGENRLIWQQMKVGCVYWQDGQERWQKRVLWGRESPEEFGQSLYFLACRCGYREASETVFAADGGDWCWRIGANYFAEAVGILDWYHASEHVYEAGKSQSSDKSLQTAWAKTALAELKLGGGRGLLSWLEEELKGKRGKKRESLEGLKRYVSGRLGQLDYPDYRLKNYQIGTGMIESTAKQLVSQRLKGSGMRWSEAGALAMTAMRALTINGPRCWSKFWTNLTLAA